MRELTLNEITDVNGGFLQLIAALVTVFVLPKVIHDHTKEYNQWGHQIGEWTYETLHPYDPNK